MEGGLGRAVSAGGMRDMRQNFDRLAGLIDKPVVPGREKEKSVSRWASLTLKMDWIPAG